MKTALGKAAKTSSRAASARAASKTASRAASARTASAKSASAKPAASVRSTAKSKTSKNVAQKNVTQKNVTQKSVSPASATKTVKPAAAPAKTVSAAKTRPAEVKAAPEKAKSPVILAAKAPSNAAAPQQPRTAGIDAASRTPAPGAVAPAGKIPAPVPAAEVKDILRKSETPAPAAPVAPKAAPVVAKAKPAAPKHGFKLNEYIVYPAHGVGQITGVEIQEVAGFSLELFVVSFIKDKMILKVPTSKVSNVGMRKLAEGNVVEKALATLSGRARIKRTMWSRRAQEYEAKINSGDLVTIAEVVRDLYRSDTQPEQSYSERQLYEAALDRMAREIAAVRKLIDSEALKLIESFLQKGPRRGPKSEADAADDGGDDADVDRAA